MSGEAGQLRFHNVILLVLPRRCLVETRALGSTRARGGFAGVQFGECNCLRFGVALSGRQIESARLASRHESETSESGGTANTCPSRRRLSPRRGFP